MPRKAKTLASVIQESVKVEENLTKTLPPHLIVKALAGTGKTTTLIEGLKELKGITPKITPSVQQRAIWDSMLLSRDARSIAFVAFNSSIADELKRRVPAGVEASTMHSLGFKAVRNAFGKHLKPYPHTINTHRVSDIICEIMGKSVWDLRRERPAFVSILQDIVSKCKMNLVDGTQEEVAQIINHYGIEIENSKDSAEIYSLVPLVLDRCKDVTKDGCIDFNDQIWLPVVLNLPMTKYDLLLVDEAQDLNKCQQTLAKRSGHRLVFCGDANQAIYGFAGADSLSLTNLQSELETETNGCVILPLTVTRRCGKAIVERAKQYVSEFEAHESNPEGKIEEAKYPVQRAPGAVFGSRDTIELPIDQTYIPSVKEGDMVICRNNAPLVKECFRFIKAGRKATIQGKKIGEGLVSLVKKMEVSNAEKLLIALNQWLFEETNKEQTKKNPDENKIEGFQDRVDCIYAVVDGIKNGGGLRAITVDNVLTRIETLFTDSKDIPGIKLSSVHKAKGLESNTVFFLKPNVVFQREAKKAWEGQQEDNLNYVGITRAIERLVFVY